MGSTLIFTASVVVAAVLNVFFARAVISIENTAEAPISGDQLQETSVYHHLNTSHHLTASTLHCPVDQQKQALMIPVFNTSLHQQHASHKRISATICWSKADVSDDVNFATGCPSRTYHIRAVSGPLVACGRGEVGYNYTLVPMYFARIELSAEEIRVKLAVTSSTSSTTSTTTTASSTSSTTSTPVPETTTPVTEPPTTKCSCSVAATEKVQEDTTTAASSIEVLDLYTLHVGFVEMNETVQGEITTAGTTTISPRATNVSLDGLFGIYQWLSFFRPVTDDSRNTTNVKDESPGRVHNDSRAGTRVNVTIVSGLSEPQSYEMSKDCFTTIIVVSILCGVLAFAALMTCIMYCVIQRRTKTYRF